MLPLVALLTLAFAANLGAQQPNTPHIGYVYPAGGRQGATFAVKVGGQFLDGVTNVYVGGAGVQATVVEHVKPPTPKQLGELREQAKALQEKRQAAFKTGRSGGTRASTNNVVWTTEDEKIFTDLRKKLFAYQGRRPANPAIAETVVLHVTMAPDADPGEREIRLGTPSALSNPLVFRVGQLPEFREKEPSIDDEPFNGKAIRARNEQKAVARTEMNVTLPAIMNGQILPGGVDRYRFHARKGQQLVAVASARELIPYLADAVPGWFQATLALYDAKGKELAYDDRYRFHPDPVIYFEVPKEGEYVVEIKDSIYRGREDFVYRIAIGELPFVTSVFPLGGPAGAQTTVELTGWNIPDTTLTLDNRDKEPGIYPFSVSKEKFTSNLVPFSVDALPECLEQEPNNSSETAQPVTLPIIVNGRISQPGDWDVFRFEGRAGDQLVAEVYARRLESPLDSVLKLTDAARHQLAFNDDYEDKGSGLNTHHADSYLTATLPVNGAYYLHVGDAQHQGGLEYAYRLRLSAPRPDFALRVVPSTINVRAGMNVPITVYALRKDGFTNDIALTLNDAPAGFALNGARVPANQAQVRLTLRAPQNPRDEPVSLSLEGRAIVEGHEVIRRAVPAEDMMQAFAYRHLVPAKELEVAVSGRNRAGPAVRILNAAPVRLPVGGTATVRIGAPSSAFADRFQFELSEPPDGVAIRKVSPSSEGAEMVLESDAAKTKPGLAGNLIVNLFAGNTPATSDKAKRPANQRRAPLGTLPAIPFEIVRQ